MRASGLLWLGFIVFVDAIADKSCHIGIKHNNGACCDIDCGSCGGSGCSQRPGGASNCCSGSINNRNDPCDSNLPPCHISDEHMNCEIPTCSNDICGNLGLSAGTRGSSKVCGGSYDCHEDKTYDEAVDICESYGMRLCTICELENDETRGSGCGFDDNRIWTQTSCSSDPSYVYTGSGSTAHSIAAACSSKSSLQDVRCCADTTWEDGDCEASICNVGIYGRTEWPSWRFTGVYYLTATWQNDRPVYKHGELDWYLFYKGGSWIAGGDITQSNGNGYHVGDTSFPNELYGDDRAWKIWDGNNWVDDANVFIDCVYDEHIGMYGREAWPANTINGVYNINYNETRKDRPVYKHETSANYMFYKSGSWITGANIDNANGQAYHQADPRTPDMILSNNDDRDWIIWTGHEWAGDAQVIVDKAYCDIVFFDATGQNAGIINREYKVIPEQTAYNRPVYANSEQTTFVYYHGDKWILGPTVGTSSASMYNPQDVQSAQEIFPQNGQWRVWNGAWEDQSVGVRCSDETAYLALELDFSPAPGTKLLQLPDVLPPLPFDFNITAFFVDLHTVLNVSHIPWNYEDVQLVDGRVEVVVRFVFLDAMFEHFGVDNIVDMCWAMKDILVNLDESEVPASFPPKPVDMDKFNCSHKPPTFEDGQTLLVPFFPSDLPRDVMDQECAVWQLGEPDTFLLGHACGIQKSFSTLEEAQSACCECAACNGVVQDGSVYFIRAGKDLKVSLTGEITFKRGTLIENESCDYSDATSGYIGGYADCADGHGPFDFFGDAQNACCECSDCSGITCVDETTDCTLRANKNFNTGTTETSYIKNPPSGQACLFGDENVDTFLLGYACGDHTRYSSLTKAINECCECDTCGGVTTIMTGQQEKYTIRTSTILKSSPFGEKSWIKGDTSSTNLDETPPGITEEPTTTSSPGPTGDPVGGDDVGAVP